MKKILPQIAIDFITSEDQSPAPPPLLEVNEKTVEEPAPFAPASSETSETLMHHSTGQENPEMVKPEQEKFTETGLNIFHAAGVAVRFKSFKKEALQTPEAPQAQEMASPQETPKTHETPQTQETPPLQETPPSQEMLEIPAPNEVRGTLEIQESPGIQKIQETTGIPENSKTPENSEPPEIPEIPEIQDTHAVHEQLAVPEIEETQTPPVNLIPETPEIDQSPETQPSLQAGLLPETRQSPDAQLATELPTEIIPEPPVETKTVPETQATTDKPENKQDKPPVKSTRGRKSLKQTSAEADLIEIPGDEVLFSKQYYTMGEVAEMFRVNQSLLRFWEAEFDVLKPRKNKKGDRYFRPVDIKNLHLIYHLLRQRKYTIEGAKDFLKKNKKAEERFEAIQNLHQIKAFLLEWKAQL